MLLIATLLPASLFAQAQLRKVFTVSRVLVASDFTMRTLDMITTHNNLTNPCRCFTERDPSAPASGAYGPEAAFQYSQSSALAAG